MASKSPAAKIPPRLRDQLNLCASEPDRVIFLDIETTGLSHYYDEITIIGWSLGGKVGTFVKGENPDEMLSALEHSRAMVTFNGIRFDQRFLVQEFENIALPETHIDLMYLCRRVSLTGGQKSIEDQLHLDFRKEAYGVDGFAAVLLWHRYLRGELNALRELIAYNRADIAAMGAIFDEALRLLAFESDLFSRKQSFRDWSAPEGWQIIPQKLNPAASHLSKAPSFRELFGNSIASKSRVVGIDLTGSAARPTGWCILDGNQASTSLISEDETIIQKTLDTDPDLVSIDSPLCLPLGRISVFDDDPGRDEYGIMRKCERELKRRGINVYPSLLPSMQKLTARGIKIAKQLREKGIPVIESYPGAAQDIMRIPRKGAGIEWLRLGLADFGITGSYRQDAVSHDELDAITSALVGTFHLAGMSEELGDQHEPPLIIPDLKSSREGMAIGVSGPIAAGKTTVAKILEESGFNYTRFSLVIDDILDERQLPKNRENRQAIGLEINAEGGQRELAERTLKRASNAKRIVIDGLRFPQDHAFLVEQFGCNYLHIFVEADFEVRKARYIKRMAENTDQPETEFELACNSAVERKVPDMRPLAHAILFNNGTKSDIRISLSEIITQLERS